MKSILLTITLIATSAASSFAGPWWKPQCHNHSQQQVYVVTNSNGQHWGWNTLRPSTLPQVNPTGVAHVYWKASNGSACYRTNNGQVWYQNPF